MDGWYVGVNGQQRGPLSFDDALAAARSAGAAQTYVWREGFGEWKIAADVPEFADALRSSTPSRPAPPSTGDERDLASAYADDPSGSGQLGRKGASFVQAIKLGFANYATFRGRACRSEYWFWFLFVFLVSIVSNIVDLALGITGGFINGITSLALFLPGLSVGVRRFHDLDRTGWWMLGFFVVVIGMIVLSLFLGPLGALTGLVAFLVGILMLVWTCTKGTVGPNRFGEDRLGG